MDWKNLIAEIQRHGELTQPQIADRVGCAQATISDLVNGATKQPRYPLGVALVDLHAQVAQPSTESTVA